MQANTRILCNAKVGTCKDGTLAPTYMGMKKHYKFWFCLTKHCMSGNKEKYVID